MDDARFLSDLRRFWDEVARGGPATPGDLDPELAADIQRLHTNRGVQPDSSYAEHLREMLMQTATAPIPLTITVPGNGHAAPRARPGPLQGEGTRRTQQRPTWAWTQAAVVLLLIAALLAAYFTVMQHEEPATFIPSVATPPANDMAPGGWSMYRGNPARTGVAASPALDGQPAILWQFEAGASATFPPAIADGVISLPTDGGTFYALDAATGAMRWQTEGGFAMPAVSNGVLFFVSADEALVARDLATDQELWTAAPGSRFWSPLVEGDTVYYGAEANLLVARDVRTGAERWVAAQPTLASRSAALADGVLVVGSDDHHVYGVDQATGTTMWQYALGGENATIQTPTIADGTAYVGTFGDEQNTFVALDLQTGAERWRLDSVGGENFQAAGVDGGLVYVPSDAGKLHALDAATGAERWTASTSEAMFSGPVIADGVLYEGTNVDGNGVVLALDAATGAEQWRLTLEGQVSFSPVLVDGRLYVGTELGNVYAIGAASDVPSDATPVVMTPDGVLESTPEAGVAGTPVAASDATLTAEWVLSTADGSLTEGLMGVAIDPFSRLWLCSASDGSIEILDRDGNQLSKVTGGLGSEPGQWNWHIALPNGGSWDGCAITFAPDGTAYVTDGGNQRIQILDPTGAFVESWSTADADDSRLFGPAGITWLANGELLVIDFGPHDIARRFSVDGTVLGDFEPGEGIDPDAFDPITVLEDGENLWVVEMAEHRVIKLAPDGSLLMAIGGPTLGTEPGQLAEPTDLALDAQGHIYVADDDNRRIQVFAPDGTFLAQFTGEEAGITRFGSEGGGVGTVRDGGKGYLYVADYSRDDYLNGEQRLIKFQVTLPTTPMGAAPSVGATPAP